MSEAAVRQTQQVVEELTAYLINSGAENYIEDHYTITLQDGPETTAVITVQYSDKPSAHELRIQAEAERDDLRAQLELALKVPSVAAMHSYLDTEFAKQNAQLGVERDHLRDALQQIIDAEWTSSETATDFALSQTKGMLISRIKGIAREALSVKP